MCISPTEDAIQFGFYPTHWTDQEGGLLTWRLLSFGPENMRYEACWKFSLYSAFHFLRSRHTAPNKLASSFLDSTSDVLFPAGEMLLLP